MFRRFTYMAIVTATLMTVSCAKTEVAFDTPSEIALAPVVGGMTKAAVETGKAPNASLVVWANYQTVNGNTTAKQGDPYFSEAVFHDGGSGWVGADGGHYWPKQGTLAFAGCTQPAEGNWTVAYNSEVDEITVTGFKQSAETSKTLDLMWFNRTDNSGSGFGAGTEAVPVVLNHALAWITIEVYGTSASADWTITGMTLKDVVTKGDVVCTTAGASWSPSADKADKADMFIFSNEGGIGSVPHVVENVSGGTVIIPQNAKMLSVSYRQQSDRELTKEIDLSDGGTIKWEAGKHYTYRLFFNPYKILFTFVEADWVPEDENPDDDTDVNVEY